jgi:hypothetical protein
MDESEPHRGGLLLSCREAGWQTVVEAGLAQGSEVELIHFSELVDGEYCQQLAARYAFAFHSIPEIYFASFRRTLRSGTHLPVPSAQPGARLRQETVEKLEPSILRLSWHPRDVGSRSQI